MRHKATLLLLTMAACGGDIPPTYDLVVANGRVMDPASGVDGVRHVGILDGMIAEVSETTLEGRRVIDAGGLVVAPGFIDLHEHGQAEEAYGLMVRDGVTTAFELEVGTGDVAAWYAERDGGQLVNYGVAVGHIPVRMQVLDERVSRRHLRLAGHTALRNRSARLRISDRATDQPVGSGIGQH